MSTSTPLCLFCTLTCSCTSGLVSRSTRARMLLDQLATLRGKVRLSCLTLGLLDAAVGPCVWGRHQRLIPVLFFSLAGSSAVLSVLCGQRPGDALCLSAQHTQVEGVHGQTAQSPLRYCILHTAYLPPHRPPIGWWHSPEYCLNSSVLMLAMY